jgi:hypothetical protein
VEYYGLWNLAFVICEASWDASRRSYPDIMDTYALFHQEYQYLGMMRRQPKIRRKDEEEEDGGAGI